MGKKFESCIRKVSKASPNFNPYAVCKAALKYVSTVKPFGETFDVYKSTRKSKQLMAVSRDRKLVVHFGDPKMKEYPGTKRGDGYCSRSLGIAMRDKTLNDVKSPNFWSRWFLWNCQMDKSLKSRPRLKKN